MSIETPESFTPSIITKWENNLAYLQDRYTLLVLTLISNRFKNIYTLNLSNVCSNSLMSDIQRKNNPDINVVSEFAKNSYIKNEKNPEQNFQILKEKLRDLAMKSKNDNKVLVIWVSSLWDLKNMQMFWEIINEIKKEFDNLIFAVGGANYNGFSDKSFINYTFEGLNFDMINIWWGEGFTNLFSQTINEFQFFRDSDWNLDVDKSDELPSNILLAWNKGKLDETIWYWKSIETVWTFDPITKNFLFYIDWMDCKNSCHYCANSTIIPNNECVDIEKSVKKFNNDLENIKEKDICVVLNTPNPFQYYEEFKYFLENINLEKVVEIWFFGDFVWIWNEIKLNKIIELIDGFTKKWKNINVTITFSSDSIHVKNDWEFIWRTCGKKIANEKLLQNWIEGFDRFFNYFKKNKQVYIYLNMIFNPKLDAQDYLERLNYLKKYNKDDISSINILAPDLNTKVSINNAWNFIPGYELLKRINIEKIPIDFFSLWGLNFENSKLLDTFQICRVILNPESIKDIFSKINTEKYDISDIFHYLKRYIITYLEYLKHEKSEEIKAKKLKTINFYLHTLISYINVILEREKYLCENNPNYNSKSLQKTLKKLEKIKLDLIEFKENLHPSLIEKIIAKILYFSQTFSNK